MGVRSVALLLAVLPLACTAGRLAAPATEDGGPTLDAAIDQAANDASPDDRSNPPDVLDVPETISMPDGRCGGSPFMGGLPAPVITPPGPPPNGDAIADGTTITITDTDTAAQIYYTTNGSVPACTGNVCTGSLYSGAPVQITFAGGSPLTVTAVAHDPTLCLFDSPPTQAIYTEATGQGCGVCAPVVFATASSIVYAPFDLGLSFPGASICYTVDGSSPTCDASGNCIKPALTYDAASGGVAIGPSVAGPTNTVTVTAIACEADAGSTPPVAQTYTFALVAPFLASANADGLGEPGWTGTDGGGAPRTTMAIPSDAGVPYGPFTAQQIDNGAFPLADYLCWSKNAVATCKCASPLPLTAAAPSATLPAAADVSPGDTLSVIACASSPAVNAATGWGPSSATIVQF
jgi:hypothetical protein